MTDPVNHPEHYQGSIECLDAIEASMTHEEFCGYLKGNIIKYVWRYKKKGLVTDLEKSEFYLKRLIKTEKVGQLERDQGEVSQGVISQSVAPTSL